MPHETVISLLLHDVTDRPETSGFLQPTAQRYKHRIGQFAEYLTVVQETGLSVDIVPTTTNSDQRAKVILTFDDGGASAPTAADLLEQHGWRGMFFVTTDLIETPGFMNKAQIRDLHQRGHVIGSHSCSHPDVFRDISRDQMKHEWSGSRDRLQQLLAAEINTVSVPGGDISATTLSEAAAAGYQHIFTSEQSTKPWLHAGARCYGRMMMLDRTTPASLRRWLRHPSLGILPEQILRLTKSSVKQMLGPVYLNLVKRRRALHGNP